MRTTLTIDDDLAVLLERKRRDTGASFKQVVNDTLRAGLVNEVEVCKPRRETFRTRPLMLGKPLVKDLSRTGELLSDLDVDDYS
ncbi:hypothetical protein [Amycolatopsis taiwanensis]|uniref:hypothetical protein n=1 Tax=Amycolatopsis taiwanensis TaxID=342230 RepID=UPI0004B8D21B|nr:hypothetical protein [Amycolatopsis taiwanensis]